MKKTALAALMAIVFIFTGAIFAAAEQGGSAASSPTIEFSGNAGDYSAYLTWSGTGNGSPITRYEISYSAAFSPDVIINTLTFDPETTSCTLSGLAGGTEHLIRLTAYNEAGSTSQLIRITPNDPDLATVTAVKNEIESSVITIHMNNANTEASVKQHLYSYLDRYSVYEVSVDEVAVTDFTPAKRKTQDDPDAPGGSFSFIVEISKGDVRMTTKKLTAQIDNSTSVIYLTATKYTVLKGEKLTVSAMKIDILSDEYSWYVSTSPSDDGTPAGDGSAVLEFNTEKSGEFYVHCVCGGVSSSAIKITVTEPFLPVSDIMLYTDSVTVGEASMLQTEVFPSDATNKAVKWSVENDGGCMASLNGRTFTAYKAGTVTVKASVADGSSDGDYEKTFYISVKQPEDTTEKETEPSQPETNVIYTEKLDCSKISGVESVEVTAEGGKIQITPVTKKTIDAILQKAGLDAESGDIITAIKFVYEDGAIAHKTEMKLKGYPDDAVRMITVNGNGGYTLTDQMTSNGTVYGNTVSPDTIILLKKNSDNGKTKLIPYILLLAVPLIIAGAVTVYLTVSSGKKKKKTKKKR